MWILHTKKISGKSPSRLLAVILVNVNANELFHRAVVQVMVDVFLNCSISFSDWCSSDLSSMKRCTMVKLKTQVFSS